MVDNNGTDPVEPSPRGMRYLLGGFKCLVAAVTVLLVAYIPSALLLGVAARTYSVGALIGIFAILIALLIVTSRLRDLQLLAEHRSTQTWSLVFGMVALVSALCFMFVLGSFSELRIRSIVPADLDTVTAVTYGLAVAAMAAISEELAFRGIVQSWLRDRLGFRWALVLTSILFCLWHIGNPIFLKVFPYYLLVSVTLGVVYELNRALIPAIALHFILDTFTILISWSLRPLHLAVLPGKHGAWLAAAALAVLAAVAALRWALPRAKAGTNLG